MECSFLLLNMMQSIIVCRNMFIIVALCDAQMFAFPLKLVAYVTFFTNSFIRRYIPAHFYCFQPSSTARYLRYSHRYFWVVSEHFFMEESFSAVVSDFPNCNGAFVWQTVYGHRRCSYRIKLVQSIFYDNLSLNSTSTNSGESLAHQGLRTQKKGTSVTAIYISPRLWVLLLLLEEELTKSE